MRKPVNNILKDEKGRFFRLKPLELGTFRGLQTNEEEPQLEEIEITVKEEKKWQMSEKDGFAGGNHNCLESHELKEPTRLEKAYVDTVLESKESEHINYDTKPLTPEDGVAGEARPLSMSRLPPEIQPLDFSEPDSAGYIKFNRVPPAMEGESGIKIEQRINAADVEMRDAIALEHGKAAWPETKNPPELWGEALEAHNAKKKEEAERLAARKVPVDDIIKLSEADYCVEDIVTMRNEGLI